MMTGGTTILGHFQIKKGFQSLPVRILGARRPGEKGIETPSARSRGPNGQGGPKDPDLSRDNLWDFTIKLGDFTTRMGDLRCPIDSLYYCYMVISSLS